MNLEKAIENFKNNGYKVLVFKTAALAADYLNEEVDGKTVGIGGSMTLENMGMYESLSSHNEVFWHWHVKEGLDPKETQRKAALADVYMCSVNGASETGELVNIDGNGNRLAGTLYGHDKVYFVMGTNKIEENLQAAIDRARNVASPLNTKRIGCKNPCLKGDKCYDCSSPERICNALVVHYKKMSYTEMEIIIIEEELGF